MTLDGVEFLMSRYHGTTLKPFFFFLFLINGEPGSVL